MGYWDCPECGTKGILGLPFCPHCKAPSTEEAIPEAPAAPELEPESGTQADASAGAAPESQVQTEDDEPVGDAADEEQNTKKGGSGSAKGK
jgi:predicted  nucleic acid-binding Zn-ribbon protein